MPTSKKIFTVQNLIEKLKTAKSLILTDYRGLDVAQMSDLRRAIKKAGGEFEVVKNTLLRRAAEMAKGKWKMENLEGPTAVLWVYKEDLAPLKALNDFIKETNLPEIKLGFWDKEPISVEKIKQLATLPGLEELEAKLVGTLRSPVFGLVNGLSWNIKRLTTILKIKAETGAASP